MDTILLGIFPPPIAGIFLPIVIVGIIGFLLCYAFRFSIFVVFPIFAAFCIYQISYLEFFTSLVSGYMLIDYTTMVLAAIAIFIGTRISWKRHFAKSSKLK